MTQYTRYLSIALAILQATGIVALAARGQLLQGLPGSDHRRHQHLRLSSSSSWS